MDTVSVTTTDSQGINVMLTRLIPMYLVVLVTIDARNPIKTHAIELLALSTFVLRSGPSAAQHSRYEAANQVTHSLGRD